jgi:mono/diheme cytochrome c family protein
MPACSSPIISEIGPRFPRRSAARVMAALLGAALLAACAATNIPQPTQKSVEYGGRNGQATTLASLKHGRTLYVGRCGSCHALHQPSEFPASEWPKLVEGMAVNGQLNEDQRRDITAYLVAVAAQMQDTTQAPPPARPGSAPSATP